MAVASIQPDMPKVETSWEPVVRLALRLGIATGVLCGLWMIGLQMTGSNGFGPKQIMAQLLVPLAALTSEWLLRRQVQPRKPGLLRSVGVGVLTALFAAVISAVSLVGLAQGAGEQALARHKAEVLEIVRVQQRENPKVKLTQQEAQQQVRNVEGLTVADMARGNFVQVLVLGLVLALPGGIFLRE